MANDPCKCPNEQIVKAGESLGNKTMIVDGQKVPYYDFENDGTGRYDTNRNHRKGLDCSHFVWEAIKLAGYRRIPYFSTDNLNNDSKREVRSGQWARPSEYFCTVDWRSDVRPGDIIVFGGHCAIVKTIKKTGSMYEGTVICVTERTIFRQDRLDGIVTAPWADSPVSFVLEDGFPMYGTGLKGITKILRPKCVWAQPKPGPWPAKPAGQGQLTDPLVLDLTGYGIRTLGPEDGIHFDRDGDGFREATGWIAPGNGFLMLDRNGNGNLDTEGELFGDSTILPNGMRATNGFQALAGYDSNSDGKIDAQDPIWSQLRIWQYDTSTQGDAGDPDFPGSMTTLDELGIVAIYLDSEVTNRTDEAGNTEVRSGHFEWRNGRVGSIAEYRLQQDTSDTVPTEYVEVPPEIEGLPDLMGYGDVYDLHQAMARDSSGQLKALVEEFASEADPAKRAAILDRIMFKWTGSDAVTTDARGPFMDGRKIVALEKFYGESRENPDANLAILWNETYRGLFAIFYGNLMAQTYLKDLYNKISSTWDEETQEWKPDMSGVIAELQAQLTNDPEQGKILLGEFARMMRGLGHDRASCLPCRELFIEMDPSLGWVIDSGGLPVYDHIGQSPDGWYGLHMFGTWGSDAIKGTGIDGVINGLNGDDVIYGTDRSEQLVNENGDALLVAGGGNDVI